MKDPRTAPTRESGANASTPPTTQVTGGVEGVITVPSGITRTNYVVAGPVMTSRAVGCYGPAAGQPIRTPNWNGMLLIDS